MRAQFRFGENAAPLPRVPVFGTKGRIATLRSPVNQLHVLLLSGAVELGNSEPKDLPEFWVKIIECPDFQHQIRAHVLSRLEMMQCSKGGGA